MRRLFATILGIVMAFMLPATALADHIDGETGWYVEYDEAGKLKDNYTQKVWADNMSQLQPGDDITLTIEVRQTNKTAADWYISNEVLKSFEDEDATGSAYGYTLSYVGPDKSRVVLYESKNVGGRQSEEGLKEATNAMDEYFLLGTLTKGQTGTVSLDVSLDGETEGNAYFDTLARLKMKFAVEPNVTDQSQTSNSNANNQRNTVTKDKVVEETRTVDKNETINRTKDDDGVRVVKEDKVVEEIVTVNSENIVTDGDVVRRVIPGDRSGLATTGDQTTLFPVYLGIAGLGLVCLALAIRNLRNKDDATVNADDSPNPNGGAR